MGSNKNVLEIVEEYLKANGFDGLMEVDGECICEVGALASCGQTQQDCMAGYKAPCDPEACEAECDFHINATVSEPAPSREGAAMSEQIVVKLKWKKHCESVDQLGKCPMLKHDNMEEPYCGLFGGLEGWNPSGRAWRVPRHAGCLAAGRPTEKGGE